jgi:hypothetical protein
MTAVITKVKKDRKKAIDPDWRKKEESLQEIIRKYPDVSPFVIIQNDVQRRGVLFTDKALERANPTIHQMSKDEFAPEGEEKLYPDSLLLRDGTSIITGVNKTVTNRDPYVIDTAGDKVVITDLGQVIEEVDYWEKPQYFDKATSRGTPMKNVINARPQRFNLLVSKYCHYWTVPGHGCKYCHIGASGVSARGTEHDRPNLRDIQETAEELVREKGRFVGICLTGGSVITGKEPFDDELKGYIDILQAIGAVFDTKKFPCQVNSVAFTLKQLERLYNETGVTSYTTDLEVFDEKLFKWICPGKAAHISFDEWKKRLYDAVGIFGKGQVNTGIVSGVELATPLGFATEDEALKADFELAEEIISHGVGIKSDVWQVGPHTLFHAQNPPSLDYFVRLCKGLYDLMRKYDVPSFMDSYRKCGMHPDTNLDRI